METLYCGQSSCLTQGLRYHTLGEPELQYKLKRCTNKECCKQCRHVMTKWPVQKIAQGTTQKLLQHHDTTDI